MRITAYKCRFTGEIFELDQRKKYIKHLTELREDMRLQREYDSLKKNFKTWLAAEKEKLVHVDMICPWILENQKRLMKTFNALNKGRWGDKWHPITDEITELKLSVKFNPHVSNSHACPHNGVTNWCAKDPTKPTGYPGFHGRIDGKTKRAKKHMSQYPTGDLLNMIGIRHGTGGGGNESWGWGWGTELFLADWPELSQQLMFDKLKGDK